MVVKTKLLRWAMDIGDTDQWVGMQIAIQENLDAGWKTVYETSHTAFGSEKPNLPGGVLYIFYIIRFEKEDQS